jgi:hypothetical protein
MHCHFQIPCPKKLLCQEELRLRLPPCCNFKLIAQTTILVPPGILKFPSRRGHSGCPVASNEGHDMPKLDFGCVVHDLGASWARFLTQEGSVIEPLRPNIFQVSWQEDQQLAQDGPAQEAPNGRGIVPGFGGMRAAIQSAAPLAGAGRFIIMLEIQSIPQTWGPNPPPPRPPTDRRHRRRPDHRRALLAARVQFWAAFEAHLGDFENA